MGSRVGGLGLRGQGLGFEGSKVKLFRVTSFGVEGFKVYSPP